MTGRPALYRVEYFEDFRGFIKYDAKKNQDDAETIAEVLAKSRKKWFRVVAHGKVLNSFDYRKGK